MWVTAYVDASFKDGKGGWAIWLRSELGRLTKSGPCPVRVQDNTAAELYAALVAIVRTREIWPGTTGICLNSDCQTVVNCLEGPVLSNPQHAAIQAAIQAGSKGLWLRGKWVKGHSKKDGVRSYLNTQVDLMAGRHTGKYGTRG